jgi:hypothetical protein
MVSEITFFELHLDGPEIGSGEQPTQKRVPVREPEPAAKSGSRLPSLRAVALAGGALAALGLAGALLWRRRSRKSDETESEPLIEAEGITSP